MTQRLKAASLIIAVLALLAVFAWVRLPSTVQAQDNLTPGMLFGPLTIGNGQHINLCMSNLGDGDITALVHFRNLTSGEVTLAQPLLVKSGEGGCLPYYAPGLVVGMARGDGRASDWVSPSNALISTMSVINNGKTQAAVLGVAKLWVRGL